MNNLFILLAILSSQLFFGQINKYDLDEDNLVDNVRLTNDSIVVNFGNDKLRFFEIPEIPALNNVQIYYTNPNEINLFYGGDRGLYAIINVYFKDEWILKSIEYYNPCQECPNQQFKILIKQINQPILNVENELNIDSRKFETLIFYDYENIVDSYKSLRKMNKDLNTSLVMSNIFNEESISVLKNKIPISKKNIKDYDDLCSILYNKGKFKITILLLNEISTKFPNRAITFLNLADNYWNIDDKDKAKENYKKHVELMKIQKKDLSKIPKYVQERINP